MFIQISTLCLALTCCQAGVPSRDLFDATKKIKIAMYDFDKTIVRNSLGEDVLNKCKATLGGECSEAGQMEKTWNDMFTKNETLGKYYFNYGIQDDFVYYTAGNGKTRLDRLVLHLKRLQDKKIGLYMVSTSWEKVPAKEWANFIIAVFKSVGINKFFDADKVLTLDDPGPGIPADKGAVIEKKLKELSLRPDDAIFVDDSASNIKTAKGKVDTLWIQQRDGMDFSEMGHVETRAIGPMWCGTDTTSGATTASTAILFTSLTTISAMLC